MDKPLLTSTEVANKMGISIHAFYAHKKIFDPMRFDKTIVNHRARPSRKYRGTFKPYWFLNDLRFGKNIRNPHGGSAIKWYAGMVDALIREMNGK